MIGSYLIIIFGYQYSDIGHFQLKRWFEDRFLFLFCPERDFRYIRFANKKKRHQSLRISAFIISGNWPSRSLPGESEVSSTRLSFPLAIE
jgi:hypothetical protein